MRGGGKGLLEGGGGEELVVLGVEDEERPAAGPVRVARRRWRERR